MTGLVEARGVVRRFGSFTANAGIDLHVGPGEVVGLIGANGAGKSTFMRIVLGLLAPSEGHIRLLGRPPSREIRRRVGYVPQGLGLYDDLTVAENLQFSAGAYGIPVPRLDDPELAAESATLVRDLPLGLLRRIAFTAALAHDPKLLVLDEPTSGVAPLARSRLWDTIRDCAERGVGALVSTHYMEEVEHCDRVVVLAAGRVVVTGTPAEVVGERRALEVRSPAWDTAYAALDAAGLPATLHGRALRLLGADEQRVRAVLAAAGVAAECTAVPATFDEVFVELAAAAVGG